MMMRLIERYEASVDLDHDSFCGEWPTCKHTWRWALARCLHEILGA